ncbi:hypothetical protein LAUMK191_05530 [Mycobacterium attenuatum]|uniref:Uncharacterized protein n=1 Tax=Mycobacterium attenuatum TaxID=2341086 RepID=A0A498QDB8_9MYCO|nr:hypothetical protein LAUMK136_05558 [Mycobacterium attenuatum]VBA60449.1 hypothetical protein LAUMK191_05530 [Mycobacterium attenuatum]
MGVIGLAPAAAKAAPTAGSNGATTSCGDSRRGVMSAVPRVPSWAEKSAAAIATMPSSALSRSTARLVNGPSGIRVAPRTELTSRILSTMSAALTVAIVLNPASLTRCKASRSAWA